MGLLDSKTGGGDGASATMTTLRKSTVDHFGRLTLAAFRRRSTCPLGLYALVGDMQRAAVPRSGHSGSGTLASTGFDERLPVCQTSNHWRSNVTEEAL
jgi:hypothetical protein